MIFRTCPKCSRRWLGDDRASVRAWESETKHHSNETRDVRCEHDKGTQNGAPITFVHRDTIAVEVRSCPCGGLMYDEGKAGCLANMMAVEPMGAA